MLCHGASIAFPFEPIFSHLDTGLLIGIGKSKCHSIQVETFNDNGQQDSTQAERFNDDGLLDFAIQFAFRT